LIIFEGSSIERLCEVAATDPTGYSQFDDRPMVRAARSLLGSVTRILLLADIVIVKQLLLSKEKVSRTLTRLESVATFTEFVKAFSIFGAEMVELAHITGERQNDLKNERRRAQMAAARSVLERSTIMLLTSSKTSLRHPECTFSKENRDTIFCQMRRAMDLIHYVVKDGVIESSFENLATRQQTVEWDSERATVFTCLKHFSKLVGMSKPYVERLRPILSSTSPGPVSECIVDNDKELIRCNSEKERTGNLKECFRDFMTSKYTSRNNEVSNRTKDL
jgi:hypothetical protein